jgi:DNA (cytosine-5)-methyltransferase 1
LDVDVVPSKVQRADVDVYVPGPPCQSFSSMGSQQGTTDARGQVFNDVLQYVQKHRPAVCILENARGLAWKFKGTLALVLRDLKRM